jgi:hypothetical protein
MFSRWFESVVLVECEQASFYSLVDFEAAFREPSGPTAADVLRMHEKLMSFAQNGHPVRQYYDKLLWQIRDLEMAGKSYTDTDIAQKFMHGLDKPALQSAIFQRMPDMTAEALLKEAEVE